MRHPADIAGNQPHLWLSPKRDEPSRRKLAINIYFHCNYKFNRPKNEISL